MCFKVVTVAIPNKNGVRQMQQFKKEMLVMDSGDGSRNGEE